MFWKWRIATALLSTMTACLLWGQNPSQLPFLDTPGYEFPDLTQSGNRRLPNLALSPDGKHLVYGSPEGLYALPVNESQPRLIPGSEGNAEQPFFSPDGKWIGYLSTESRTLNKISIAGGKSEMLCSVAGPASLGVAGADWSADNTIVYGLSGTGPNRGIMRVSAEGGLPETVVTAQHEEAVFPQILPGGKRLLYTVSSKNKDRLIVLSLDSKERTSVIEGYAGRYFQTGHIVFRIKNRAGAFAVPFNLEKLEVEGDPVPILEGEDLFAISESGTLAYAPGENLKPGARRILVWVNRSGEEEPISAKPDAYSYPRISPNGTSVALTVDKSICIWNFAQETMTQFPSGNAVPRSPLWTRDGKRLVFTSGDFPGDSEIWWMTADGSGGKGKIASVKDKLLLPWTWDKEGKILAMEAAQIDKQGRPAFDLVTVSAEGKAKLLTYEMFLSLQPKISPDGRWLAYTTIDPQGVQVCVRSYPPNPRAKWRVSLNGGRNPLWSPDGRELFYRDGDAVVSVAVKAARGITFDYPRELFRGPYTAGDLNSPWDISPDGKRFLMMKEMAERGRPRHVEILPDWFSELKRRAPAKK